MASKSSLLPLGQSALFFVSFNSTILLHILSEWVVVSSDLHEEVKVFAEVLQSVHDAPAVAPEPVAEQEPVAQTAPVRHVTAHVVTDRHQTLQAAVVD